MKNVIMFLLFLGMSQVAHAYSRFSIGPYASVSSTKIISPGDEGSSNEVATTRTTYGLRISIGLMRWLSFDAQGGINEVDRTRKAVAMRDEFEDIDFEEDANVDTSDPEAEYRYQEKQTLGVAKFMFSPRFFNVVWGQFGAGVRVRQREIKIDDMAAGTSESIKDPFRYHAVASAGIRFRLLRSFTGSILYDFYFLQFPELEPHEQEVSVSFGVSI